MYLLFRKKNMRMKKFSNALACHTPENQESVKFKQTEAKDKENDSVEEKEKKVSVNNRKLSSTKSVWY